jgi:hypothetical protein
MGLDSASEPPKYEAEKLIIEKKCIHNSVVRRSLKKTVMWIQSINGDNIERMLEK